MRCTLQLTYLAQVVRDFAARLEPSARVAFEGYAQQQIDAIAADLAKPLAETEQPNEPEA